MKPQHTADSSVTLTPDGKHVTADGLVLKNLNRVEEIEARMRCRIDAEFRSWQMCRHVRRDFNFVAAHMFYKMTRRDFKDQVLGLVHEVRLQAELLAIASQSFESNPAPEIRIVPLRIISATSASLFKAFLCADAAYTRLNFAVTNHRLDPDDVRAYGQEFEYAFSDLKRFCATKSADSRSATAHELGVSQGIA